jgi:hypothetical protein
VLPAALSRDTVQLAGWLAKSAAGAVRSARRNAR